MHGQINRLGKTKEGGGPSIGKVYICSLFTAPPQKFVLSPSTCPYAYTGSSKYWAGKYMFLLLVYIYPAIRWRPRNTTESYFFPDFFSLYSILLSSPDSSLRFFLFLLPSFSPSSLHISCFISSSFSLRDGRENDVNSCILSIFLRKLAQNTNPNLITATS